jgi:hypothetical protein
MRKLPKVIQSTFAAAVVTTAAAVSPVAFAGCAPKCGAKKVIKKGACAAKCKAKVAKCEAKCGAAKVKTSVKKKAD